MFSPANSAASLRSGYGSPAQGRGEGEVQLQWLLLRVLAALVLLPTCIWGQAAAPKLKTAPLPSWAEAISADAAGGETAKQESGGQQFILLDTQINTASSETLVHVVKEITSEAGVQSGANLQFSWDPSYQELLLHQVTLERGTARMERLELSRFKIIQQESDLDQHIYNGMLSAVLFLEDVRVGDRIEYAFTLRGENPSLQGRYSTSLLLTFGVPVEERSIRVLCPAERPLKVRLHGLTAPTQMHERAGMREYRWNFHQLPGVIVEDRVPTWYPAYAWLQLSEYRHWSEVAAWASCLLNPTNIAAPELQQEIANLKGGTAEQTVQRAVEFVQNNIRYLGIEFGPNSYRPTEPVTVLKRRFGDCKDKAVLLCALLRGLGYEATPVLVGTGFRQTLPELLPAPHDFDHVIVRVVAGQTTYWLDPTRSWQRGPISQRYLPDYGFGLLARSGETALTPIPASDAGAPEAITREAFTVGGQKAPTQLLVTTTYKGADAEAMRSLLTAGGRERVAKSYLNDYAQRYPGTVETQPMVVEDAPDADTLTLTQHFTITNFWVLTEDKQKYRCEFYPLPIHNWIAKPSTAVRTMPLEVSFPRRRFFETTIELPRDFRLSNSTNYIKGPAAELRVTRFCQGQTVCLQYDYRALTNCVSAVLASEHLRSVDQMEEALGYSLHWQNLETPEAGQQVNWPIFLLGLCYASLFGAGAGWLCRYHCRRSAELPVPELSLEEQKLKGLGGWLVLVGFGLIVRPIRQLSSAPQFLHNFSPWNWHLLTSAGAVSYHPLWGPLLIIELLAQISLLVVGLFALALFFQRRRIFPYWFILLIALNAVCLVIDAVGVHLIKPGDSAGTSRNVLSAVGACSIWIPYMLWSRRVKATFVH